MRLASLLLLAAGTWGYAQPPVPLTISGPVKTVTIVEAVPFTVEAPKGGLLYFWQFPQSVEATKAAGKLTVTKATRGEHVITVEMVIVDFDKKVAETKSGTVTFVFGGIELPKPPPVPISKLFFLIVRPDGPTDPATTKILSLPAWDELRASGHAVSSATQSESVPLNLRLPPGTRLPAVVTLRSNGQASTIVRGPVPMPTSAETILKLPEGL